MSKKTAKRSAGKYRPARWRHPEGTSPYAARPAHREEMADTGLAAMRLQSREQLFNVWDRAQLGLSLTPEEARLLAVMREHEAWYGVWNRLREYSAEEIEIDGVNPVAHVMFHGVAENQLAADNPKDVRPVLEALLRQGLDRHEAIHRIAQPGSVRHVERPARVRCRRLCAAAVGVGGARHKRPMIQGLASRGFVLIIQAMNNFHSSPVEYRRRWLTG